ncbi:BTAD domain-containing putative transcriptional regulator [Streptomyces sp. NPDC057638]|uniref:AfsR/SARP family transcriptional regulator n=1 Tax=Streptomyces sp. NPDC057638 TaxID=3346190 RepID=UPI0036A1FA1C
MTAEGTEGPRFSVLGPVRAWLGSEPLPTGSPQQRALLVALLLRQGRTATAAELIDSIWGENPPVQGLAVTRTYASRLRKALGPRTVVSESGGYAVRCEPLSLDLHVAEELALEAEKARAAGSPDQARTLLNKSLGLWDGEPLASVPGPYAEHQRARLDEWRLRLLETRLDLDLMVGAHAEAVSELTALTAIHPLRERMRELLMLALYRSGRQAEALAVYADTRRLLAEELGVDPRPELSELLQRILRADEELAQPTTRKTSTAPVIRPAQLPPAVPDFTGHTALIRELSDRLATAEGAVMAVSALAGIGGVGKTTLAVHLAHRARPQFPDGQLYVDLQGTTGRPLAPVVALGTLLRSFGIADARIPESLDERTALYRSVLTGRRVLVLLDNARDAAQIRPLLPGSAGCAALVTSRVRMVDLAGAHLVDLDVMSPEEALQLFTRIVGEERVGAEREAALDVVGACGFLPLAIRIAASRLAARRTWTVSVLAAKLADERRRLDELQAGDLAVKATFELGYGQLEPAQARAFRLLGLADGPSVSLAAAAALLDLPLHQAEDQLEALVDTSLLDSPAPGRYRYHDLVRLYARACAERDDTPDTIEGSLSRLLDFYLATARRMYASVWPGDRFPEHMERAEHPGLSFASRKEALDWLYTEAHSLLACARQSTVGGRLRHAVDLLWIVRDLAESGTSPHQYEATARAALAAARATGDTRSLGRAYAILSTVHLVMGRYLQADDHARRADELAEQTRDQAVAFSVHVDRGVIALNRGAHAEAEDHLHRAITDARADGNTLGEAVALCRLSPVSLALGRTEQAIDVAAAALDIYERTGTTLRLAGARYALGVALTAAGRPKEALEQLYGALSGFEASRQRLWEGTTHFRIAQALLRTLRPARASAHAELALALGCIGGEHTKGSVLVTLGRVLAALDHPDRARTCWLEALSLHEKWDIPFDEEVERLLTTQAS